MLLGPAHSASTEGTQQVAPSAADSGTNSLATFEGRVATFRNSGWPVRFLSGDEMAGAGFFFLGRGDDAVQCFYCGAIINSWEPSDVPIVEHQKWAPRCPFLNIRGRGCADAVSYDSCTPFDPPQPQTRLEPMPAPPRPEPMPVPTPVHATKPLWSNYRTRESRLASFREWPPAIPVKPAELSDAGFFYAGVGDRTVCYYCGHGLRDWEPNDDPWVEHELWFPGCRHVQLHRGNDFVTEISAKKDALIAAKRNPRETAPAVVVPVESSMARRGGETRVKESGNTENVGADEKRICKICFENEMGVVFLPCGHIVACVDCALAVSECPMCRRPFETTARVYLS